MREVHGPKEFACEKCGKMLPSQSLLNRHMKLKHEAKLEICDVCGQSVPAHEYAKHKLRFHTSRDKWPYKCTLCTPSKGFVTQLSLEEHMNTHTGEKPFKCKLCENVAYASRGNLQGHIRSFHKGIKRKKK